MDAWNVLRALKAGEISVDEAKKQLTQAPDPALSPASPATSRDLGEHYGLVLSTVHHLDELSWREWVVPEPGADEVTIVYRRDQPRMPVQITVTMPASPVEPPITPLRTPIAASAPPPACFISGIFGRRRL